VVPLDLIRHQAIAHIEENVLGNGVFARLFEFEEGATGLIDLAKSDMSEEIEELLPPQDRHFLSEEIVLLISHNHVIACGLGNKQGTFAQAMALLAERSGATDPLIGLRIADVPNKTTLDTIAREGVKTIELNIESYLATLEGYDRGPFRDRVMDRLFTRPDSSGGLEKRAQLTGRLHLKRGRFKKEEIERDEWLTSLGTVIVESDYEGSYKIVLENDQIVSNENLRVTKPVGINRHANSVSYSQTKLELASFLKELEVSGALHW
jgi:hypothetical protein